MSSRRVGSPQIEHIDIKSVGTNQTDTVDDHPLSFGSIGSRSGRAIGSSISVGEHYDNFCIGRSRVEKTGSFYESILVVGIASGHKRIYGSFESIYGGDKLCVGCRTVCKAHYTDMAASTVLQAAVIRCKIYRKGCDDDG